MGTVAPCDEAKDEEVLMRGTLLWVNLEDAHPPEMGKTRPAIVVSNSEQNDALRS